MTDQYPTRDRHFAHRYCRLLTKTCAAQEIGHIGFCLCVTIAMLEDSKRYTGPVTFYNGQLLPLLAINKWDTLDTARKRAADHGWLHYGPGGTRRVGVYWVTIPASYGGIPDAPVDEIIPAITPALYPANGYSRGDNRGDNGGEPSILALALSSGSGSGKAGPGSGDVELSEEDPILADAHSLTVPSLPARSLERGVFAPLQETHLRSVAFMVEWHARQLSAQSPVVSASEADLLRVIAASMYASRMSPDKVRKSRVGVFVGIVTKKSWSRVTRYIPDARQALDEFRASQEEATS